MIERVEFVTSHQDNFVKSGYFGFCKAQLSVVRKQITESSTIENWITTKY